MREAGVLVPGAPAGRKGSGCYKLSAEEKERMAVAQRAAAKKLKAQQKKGSGKVKLHWQIMLSNVCVSVASVWLQDPKEDCQEGWQSQGSRQESFGGEETRS